MSNKFDKNNFNILLLIGLVVTMVPLGLFTFIKVGKKVPKHEEVVPKTIVASYEKTKIFYFDSAYQLATKHSLNKDSSIELINNKNDIYFVYLEYKKTDYRNFDDFFKKTLEENIKQYGDPKTEVVDITIDKLKGKTVDFEILKDGISVYLRAFLFEEETNYGEILIWGEATKKQQIISDLNDLKIVTNP